MNASVRDRPASEAPPRRRPRAQALHLFAWFGREAAALNPGCFALVMATGIVSNAFFLVGRRNLADALFAVNLLAYAWLWLLTAARAARAPAALVADLASPHRVFLFFTAVAATDVLGMSIALRGLATAALVFWLFALALWVVLIYLGFAVFLFRNDAARADVIEGAWLNAIVGTQSLAILGGAVALPTAHADPQVFLLLPALWAVGFGLYAILIVLMMNRLMFAPVGPDDVEPPLWIVMGAGAITVNAGTILAQHGGANPFLRSLTPFFGAATLATWAWATWLIPLLVLLGIWKHGVHRVPICYSAMLWSMVFPLGMYAVATLRVARLADAPALATFSGAMGWIALLAWAATAGGLIAATVRSLRAYAEYP